MAEVTATGRPRLRSESGNAVIELAFTLPLLLVVVMGIFDFGFMFQQYELVTNAAREGARIGVLPGYTAADASARAIQYLASGGISPCTSPNCTVTPVVAISAPFGSPAKTVNQITVTVQYVHRFVWIGPILNLIGSSLGTVTLQGVSVMRVES